MIGSWKVQRCKRVPWHTKGEVGFFVTDIQNFTEIVTWIIESSTQVVTQIAETALPMK